MRNFSQKGFTLLELIMVVVVVGIMTTVMLVSLSGGRTEKEVEAEAEKVAVAVRETQNLSLTGKNAGDSCDTVIKENFFHYGENSNGSDGDKRYAISGCNTAEYLLENGVKFSSSAGSFSFSIPNGKISLADTVTIVLEKAGMSYNVCVYPSGRLEVKKGSC